MKRTAFLLLFIFLAINFPQQNSVSLQEKIHSLIPEKISEQTVAAIDIFDLTENKPVFQLNEKLLLHPASANKIITTYAALKLLGDQYTFRTEIFLTGAVTDSSLNGDIYIRGGFDPDFSYEDMDVFISALKNRGIKFIIGNLYADISRKDSLYRGSGWMWDDDPSSDAPFLSALNVNENTVTVSFVKNKSSAEVILSPVSNYFKIENFVVPDNSLQTDSIFITRDWVNFQNTIIIKGKYNPAKNTNMIRTSKLNLMNPELYFLSLFSRKLDEKGISITGNFGTKSVPDSAVYLTSFFRPIKDVLKKINKKSYNLGAEMILYALSESKGCSPASASEGIKKIDSLLYAAGFDSTDYRMTDGSGVSRYNLLSASMLNELLKFIYYNEKKLFPVFLELFPVAGIDGTLENRMRYTSAYGRVKAKTGTLSGVSSLAGYVFSKSGNIFSFAILMQNYIGQSASFRKIQDEICSLLAAQ